MLLISSPADGRRLSWPEDPPTVEHVMFYNYVTHHQVEYIIVIIIIIIIIIITQL